MGFEYKISVIIPVYNTEKYLAECLKSLLEQTLEGVEIICVDDGSTDGSADILAKFASRGVKIITQKNSGQSAARNNGLKAAKGEYIAFLDSDDWAEKTFLETLYNLAKKGDTDISMCSINVYNEARNSQTAHDCYLSLDVFSKRLEGKCFDWQQTKDFLFNIAVVPWNKIYKSEFLKNSGLKFVEEVNFEDNIFFTETFLKAKRVNFTRAALVNYRYFSKTSYSTSGGENDFKKLDFFKIFELIEKVLKREGAYRQLSKYFKAYRQKTLIQWFDKTTDEKAKKEFAKKLYTMYPQMIFNRFSKRIKLAQRIKKLNKLTSKKRIIFRGASVALAETLSDKRLQHRENIMGIVDKNPEKIGTEFCGIKIDSCEMLKSKTFDEIVLSTPNFYNFEKIVKEELKELGIELELNSRVFK